MDHWSENNNNNNNTIYYKNKIYIKKNEGQVNNIVMKGIRESINYKCKGEARRDGEKISL